MAEESENMSKDGGSDASNANNSNGIKIDSNGDSLHMNGTNGSVPPPPNNGNHHHHHHHHHMHKKDLNLPPENDFYNNNEQKQHLQAQQIHGSDDGLGPLPPKWEKAYTDNGEAYFIE